MTKARWCHLMEDDSVKLTEEELSLGWHFCPEWDGLLIGPGMGEEETCLCFPDKPKNRKMNEWTKPKKRP